MSIYDILKKSKFPVWNDFKFCLTSRHTDRVKILSLLSAHVRLGRMKRRSTVKLQIRFLIHVLIRVQNITFN